MTATTYRTGQFTAAHGEDLAGRIADVTETGDDGQAVTYHGALVLGALTRPPILRLVVTAAEAGNDPSLAGVTPRNVFLADVCRVGGVRDPG